jgi:hypothetical protein
MPPEQSPKIQGVKNAAAGRCSYAADLVCSLNAKEVAIGSKTSIARYAASGIGGGLD